MESTRYRLFRLTAHGRFVVAENAKGPLSPYRVTQPISHPWAGPKIGIGSIMLLSDQTAEKMLAAGAFRHSKASHSARGGMLPTQRRRHAGKRNFAG